MPGVIFNMPSIALNDILVTTHQAFFKSSFISVSQNSFPGLGLFLILIGLSVISDSCNPTLAIHSFWSIPCINWHTVGDEGHNRIWSPLSLQPLNSTSIPCFCNTFHLSGDTLCIRIVCILPLHILKYVVS